MPGSRAARWRLLILLGILFGTGFKARLDRVALAMAYGPREGDIVFQSLPHGPLVDAIEGVTRSEWSHCGVLMRHEGRWMVAEALGEVRWTPWVEWVVRGRGSRVDVYRKDGLGEAEIGGLRREIAGMLGRPYDFSYAPGPEEIYCSELVHRAFAGAMDLELAPWDRLGDLNWRPHEQFIREMEAGPPPLNRMMITPVALTRSPHLRRVLP
jgi:hypothetical protein